MAVTQREDDDDVLHARSCLCSLTSNVIPTAFVYAPNYFWGHERPCRYPVLVSNSLYTQVFCRPRDVIIGKGSHEVIAVIIIWLHAEIDALVVAGFFCCLDKILGKQLLLFVEVVSCALSNFSLL